MDLLSLVLSLTRFACVVTHRGGTTVFVTLDSARYMKLRRQAAQFAKKRSNVSVSDSSAADVELVITMIYSIYVNGNVTAEHKDSYSITVQNCLPVLCLIA